MKKRTGDPWMPAPEYGRSLAAFMANLVVRDIERSVSFYTDVLAATCLYSDPDFAALTVAGVPLMLHADHTYDSNPWYDQLVAGAPRGIGAELRLFGMNPADVERRARAANAPIIEAPTIRGHGWREMMVQDPDGYVWAVGVGA